MPLNCMASMSFLEYPPYKPYNWQSLQYIPRNMHTVFALLCFVLVIHWLIFPYPPGLLRWHCGNLTIAPVPAKQPWWIWINTSCEIFMNDYITTTKQSTTQPCAYLLGYTVLSTVIIATPSGPGPDVDLIAGHRSKWTLAPHVIIVQTIISITEAVHTQRNNHRINVEMSRCWRQPANNPESHGG